MPKNSQTVSLLKSKKARKNERVELNALTDKDARFGRTIKALGNGMFRVVISEKDYPERLLEITARVGGRGVARIQINDIVIIAESGRAFEVLGSVSRKNTLMLQKEKRIHPALLDGAMDGSEDQIEFEDGDAEVNVDEI